MINAESIKHSVWYGPLAYDNIELVADWMREWLTGHRFVDIFLVGQPCPVESLNEFEYMSSTPDVTPDIRFDRCDFAFKVYPAEALDRGPEVEPTIIPGRKVIQWSTGRSLCSADVSERVPDTRTAYEIMRAKPRDWRITMVSFDWRKGLVFSAHSGAGWRCTHILQRQESAGDLAKWEGE